MVLALSANAWGISSGWETDFAKAKARANTEQKLILLNFSGSDWCIPCIRLKKEVFNDSLFLQYADEHLLLVNADFPRSKKNQLPKGLEDQNNQLAEHFNPKGSFPLTILMDANEKILKVWEGNPDLSPETFINQIKAYDSH
nr:thioredoxin family protein [Flavihumibacter rivuli]